MSNTQHTTRMSNLRGRAPTAKLGECQDLSDYFCLPRFDRIMYLLFLLLCLHKASAQLTQTVAIVGGCPSTNGTDCTGHGTCEDNGNLKVCKCDRGYGGANCAISGCSDPQCGGHGSCQDPAVTPGLDITIAACLCDGGWTGDTCTTASNACNPGCIEGNGVCNSGTCDCLKKYAGPTCGEEACGTAQKCSDHGTCDTSNALVHHTCKCRQGWAGRACDKKEQECEDSTCGGNGMCDATEGICICDKGFAGKACKARACPHDCYSIKKQGSCLNGARCVCAAGFTGEGCAYKDCPHNCGVSFVVLFVLFVLFVVVLLFCGF